MIIVSNHDVVVVAGVLGVPRCLGPDTDNVVDDSGSKTVICLCHDAFVSASYHNT